MRVVVIGAPATGKSSISRRVAAALGVPYTDTDSEIEREHGSIRDIFETYGEPFFRRCEREAVIKALEKGGVISFGGGAVLNPDTQADLADADVVLLTMTPDAARSRISNNKRPLVKGLESWEAIARKRGNLYASLADYTVDTSRKPMSVLAREITKWVKSRHEADATPDAETGKKL